MKQTLIGIACVIFLWTVDALVYRGVAARWLFSQVATLVDRNSASGTIRQTEVNSGYVVLYLSRNRPCDAIAVPVSEFRPEIILAVLKRWPAEQVASLLTIGQSLVGERVSAKGKVAKQDDGCRFVFVESLRDVHFEE